MRFKNIIPILYSTDVARSVRYYIDILGFDDSWLWGHPATFAGVNKGRYEIFFCKDGQGNPGTWLSIFVDNVDEYYDAIKSKGAAIVSPPQTMEWNVREMLIEDPDGHKIRFGQHKSTRDINSSSFPENIRIISRKPSPAEHQELILSVGWSATADEQLAAESISPAIYAVVAEDMISNKIIGCAMIMSDNKSIYYIKDVMVHPNWQNKLIGTALMKEINNWLDQYAADKAQVMLITGDNLSSFYSQFGFKPVFAMSRQINKNK